MNLQINSDQFSALENSEDVPVLWVFKDYDSRWRFRKEGTGHDMAYPSRKEALLAARIFGTEHGSYRLYLQLTDGRFVLELLNTAVFHVNDQQSAALRLEFPKG